MKKSIWKFALETMPVQQIEMPEGAEILTIQTQNEHPCIWALVDTTAPKRKITFEIFGTSHVIYDEEKKYIGTYQLDNGAFVFHCFLIN